MSSTPWRPEHQYDVCECGDYRHQHHHGRRHAYGRGGKLPGRCFCGCPTFRVHATAHFTYTTVRGTV